MTPLHWAVVRHYPKLVTLLLKYGGDATAASKFNKTPIVIALETKQNDIFQELIMHNEMATSQQEQQEATNSLMFEMKKDNSNETEQMDLEPSIIYESPENSPSQTIENNISTIDSKQTGKMKNNTKKKWNENKHLIDCFLSFLSKCNRFSNIANFKETWHCNVTRRRWRQYNGQFSITKWTQINAIRCWKANNFKLYENSTVNNKINKRRHNIAIR